MDIATLIGVIGGVLCTIIPIILGGSPLAFYNFQSILITVGGAIASTLISYPMKEALQIVRVAANAFRKKGESPEDIILLLVELSQKARREGILSLEMEYERLNNKFLEQSLQLVVDGAEPEVIIDSMDLELENLRTRHERGQGLFKTLGAMFPAWGMIGTLIGLINLLRTIDDPSNIGPSMAVALVTTFYGSVLANFVCLPIANKLALKSKEEIQLKKIMVEGILSIQAGENPKIMEHKLMTFLSPEQKERYMNRAAAARAGVDVSHAV